jgi:hypothetical protein
VCGKRKCACHEILTNAPQLGGRTRTVRRACEHERLGDDASRTLCSRLITQRSQVQILPPQRKSQVREAKTPQPLAEGSSTLMAASRPETRGEGTPHNLAAVVAAQPSGEVCRRSGRRVRPTRSSRRRHPCPNSTRPFSSVTWKASVQVTGWSSTRSCPLTDRRARCGSQLPAAICRHRSLVDELSARAAGRSATASTARHPGYGRR